MYLHKNESMRETISNIHYQEILNKVILLTFIMLDHSLLRCTISSGNLIEPCKEFSVNL